MANRDTPRKLKRRPTLGLFLLCLMMALQGCGRFNRGPEGEGILRKEYDTRVRFERSGGVAGTRTATVIDSKSLPQKEAQHLRNLIDESGFFGLPEEILGPRRPDEFIYTITVEIDGRQHTVRTTDTASPAQLKPLIERLNEAARKGQGQP